MLPKLELNNSLFHVFLKLRVSLDISNEIKATTVAIKRLRD